MIVLVDTSVWIDFFCGSEVSHVAMLERLLTDSEDVCIAGVILTEILQGIRRDRDYKKTKSYMERLLYLQSAKGTFIRAAELYRALRRKGLTIRKPIDCMIASLALENDVALLHNDRDFDPMEKHCGLEVLKSD